MELDEVPIKGRNISHTTVPNDKTIGYVALCIAIFEDKKPFPALKRAQKRLKS